MQIQKKHKNIEKKAKMLSNFSSLSNYVLFQ